jgi:hypothetical protein
MGNAVNTWLHTPSGKHWPSIMLKDSITNARILSFEYDADIVSQWTQPSTNSVSNHAENLLGAVLRLAGKDANRKSENRIRSSVPVDW